MRRFLLALLLLLAPCSLWAQTPANILAVPETTTPALTDMMYIVIDPAGTPLDRKVTLQSIQDLIAIGEADTDQSTHARGNYVIANSLATSMEVRDDASGTNKCGWFFDGANGFVFQCTPETNRRIEIPVDKTLCIFDKEGAANVLCIDPDAATTRQMYSFDTAYRPKKSIWIDAGALFGDGTQCPAAPSTVTINSGAPRQTFICTDNDASSLYGEVLMPKSWDGGTVTFAHVYLQTAVDTNPINGDIAASCRISGNTRNNTWGTEVAIDNANVSGSNQMDVTTSGAVTPGGTCNTPQVRMLQFRYQLDAAGTTTAAATLHHMGFMIEFSVNTLSD